MQWTWCQNDSSHLLNLVFLFCSICSLFHWNFFFLYFYQDTIKLYLWLGPRVWHCTIKTHTAFKSIQIAGFVWRDLALFMEITWVQCWVWAANLAPLSPRVLNVTFTESDDPLHVFHPCLDDEKIRRKGFTNSPLSKDSCRICYGMMHTKQGFQNSEQSKQVKNIQNMTDFEIIIA